MSQPNLLIKSSTPSQCVHLNKILGELIANLQVIKKITFVNFVHFKKKKQIFYLVNGIIKPIIFYANENPQ